METRKQIKSANYQLTKVQGQDRYTIVEKINQKSIAALIIKGKTQPNKWQLKIDYYKLALYEQNEAEDREREMYDIFAEFNKN